MDNLALKGQITVIIVGPVNTSHESFSLSSMCMLGCFSIVPKLKQDLF